MKIGFISLGEDEEAYGFEIILLRRFEE